MTMPDEARSDAHGPDDPWLRRQARVLVHALGLAGLTMPLGAAAGLVEDRVRHAVETSGLSEQQVRRLLQPEHVRAMAAAVAAEVTRGPAVASSECGTARLGGPLDPTFRATG